MKHNSNVPIWLFLFVTTIISILYSICILFYYINDSCYKIYNKIKSIYN